jgi:hypothetical protein
VTCFQKVGGKTELKDAESGKEHLKLKQMAQTTLDSCPDVFAKRNTVEYLAESQLKQRHFIQHCSKIRLDDNASC